MSSNSSNQRGSRVKKRDPSQSVQRLSVSTSVTENELVPKSPGRRKRTPGAKHTERLKLWNSNSESGPPTTPPKKKKGKGKRHKRGVSANIAARAGFLSEEKKEKKKNVYIKRKSQKLRAAEARKLFLANDASFESTTQSICPLCNEVVLLGERNVKYMHQGEYCHSVCYRTHEQEQYVASGRRVIDGNYSTEQLSEEAQLAGTTLNKKEAITVWNTRCEENASENNDCPGCGQVVFLQERGVFYRDAYWHVTCFRCTQCNRVMLAGQFKTHEGEPMCDPCYEHSVLAEMFENSEVRQYKPEDRISYFDIEIDNNIRLAAEALRRHKIELFSIHMIDDHTCELDSVLPVFGADPVSWHDFQPPERGSYRKNATTEDEFNQLCEIMYTDRCNIIGTYMMYTLVESNGYVSRTCDKFCLFLWLPEENESKEKVVYGTATGFLHTSIPGVGKVFTVTRRNEYTLDAVVEILRKTERGT